MLYNSNFVSFFGQTLSTPQKQQARQNIGMGTNVYGAPSVVMKWTPPSGTDFVSNLMALFAGVLAVGGGGGNNTIVGACVNDTAPGTAVFPTAVTGAAELRSAGGTVFGGFFSTYLYSVGTGTGAEINTFNMNAAPSPTLPPNTAFGTPDTVPVILTIAAAGSFGASLGIRFCREGATPQPMLTAAYVYSDAATNNGFYVDATSSTGATDAATFCTPGAAGKTALKLISRTAAVVGTPIMTIADTVQVRARFEQDGALKLGVAAINGNTQTTLVCTGNDTITSAGHAALPYVSAAFGVNALMTGAIASMLLIGSTTGSAPFLAAYGPNNLQAPLTFKACTATALYDALVCRGDRQSVSFNVPIEPITYTVATLPTAGLVDGSMVYCTNARALNGAALQANGAALSTLIQGAGVGTGSLVTWNVANTSWYLAGTNIKAQS